MNIDVGAHSNYSRYQRRKDHCRILGLTKGDPVYPRVACLQLSYHIPLGKQRKEILPKRDVNVYTRMRKWGQTSTGGILFLVIISLFED